MIGFRDVLTLNNIDRNQRPAGVGVLPYITYIACEQALCLGKNPGGYSHTLPIRVCATQRGRDFEAPDLERGIHFRGVF